MPRKKAVRDNCYIVTRGERSIVSQETYDAYYGGQRYEKYQKERDEKFGVKPFSSYGADGENILEAIPSDVDIEEEICQKMLLEQLSRALIHLEASELDLVKQIYSDCLPLKQIAKSLGVTEGTVRYRRDQILKKLRKYF